MIDDFWEENKELFQKIIEVKCATTTGDLHNSFVAINNEITNTKDKSRYSVDGKGKYNKIGMAKAAMTAIIEKMSKEEKEFDEIINNINSKWGTADGKKQVLGDSVASFSKIYSAPEVRCREFQAAGRTFYIDYKWDAYNIDEGIATFKNVFGINIEKI